VEYLLQGGKDDIKEFLHPNAKVSSKSPAKEKIKPKASPAPKKDDGFADFVAEFDDAFVPSPVASKKESVQKPAKTVDLLFDMPSSSSSSGKNNLKPAPSKPIAEPSDEEEDEEEDDDDLKEIGPEDEEDEDEEDEEEEEEEDIEAEEEEKAPSKSKVPIDKKPVSAPKPLIEKKSSKTELLFDLPDDAMFKFEKKNPSLNSSLKKQNSSNDSSKKIVRKASQEDLLVREDWVTF
jgi:hypothetical protein